MNMKKSAYDRVTEAQERIAQLDEVRKSLVEGSASMTDLYDSNKTFGKVVDVLDNI